MTCPASWNEQPRKVSTGRRLTVRYDEFQTFQLLHFHIQETANHALLA